jgi:hypothetical protein
MNETSLQNQIIRNNGSIYRLSAYKFGRSTLISAEGTYGPDKGKVYDLRCAHPSKSKIADELRSALKLGLVS